MAKTSEKIKITKTTVERSLPYRYTDDTGVERVRQKVYFDTLTPGFGFVVGPGGAKSFFAQYSSQRNTFGRFGILTVDQARREAMTLLGRMAKGENVKETERRERTKSITFGEATDRYLDDLKHEDRSERTLHGYRYMVDTYLDDWKNRPLAEITRKDVYGRHRQLAADIERGKYARGRRRQDRSGKRTANGAFRVFRAIYNATARIHEDLPQNPCIAVRWFPEQRRKTAITSDRLNLWYQEVRKLENPIRRDYLVFTLLYGVTTPECC